MVQHDGDAWVLGEEGRGVGQLVRVALQVEGQAVLLEQGEVGSKGLVQRRQEILDRARPRRPLLRRRLPWLQLAVVCPSPDDRQRAWRGGTAGRRRTGLGVLSN